MSKRPSPLSPTHCTTGTRLRCEQLEDRAVPSAGDFDPTFSGDGIAALTNFRSDDLDVAVQADGKVVAIGGGTNGDFRVSRLNANGTPDTSFASAGTASTDINKGTDYARAMAVQDNGKLVVAGYGQVKVQGQWVTQNALVRYNANGTLDSTFGTGGKVTTAGTGGVIDMMLQADEKIVTVGRSGSGDLAVCRYNANGSLDTTFGTGGKVILDFFGWSDGGDSVALQADGKIVVSGWAQRSGTSVDVTAVLLRFNSNGSLDTTFDGDGKVFPSAFFASINDFSAPNPSLAIQDIGGQTKILLGGGDGPGGVGISDFLLSRYNSDGSLDTSFGTNGLTLTDFDTNYDELTELAVQTDGKIIAVGDSASSTSNLGRFALARYSPDGILDATFGTGGLVAFQVDPNFGGSIKGVTIQGDGKIVGVGSGGSQYVFRFLGDDSGGGGGGAEMMSTAPTDSATQKPLAVEGLDGSLALFGRFVFDPTLDRITERGFAYN